MRRLLIILLTAFVLLTQWGLAAHAYQDHDEAHVCELCLAQAQHDHVLLPSIPVLSLLGNFEQTSTPSFKTFTPLTLRHYPVRAPPHTL